MRLALYSELVTDFFWPCKFIKKAPENTWDPDSRGPLEMCLLEFCSSKGGNPHPQENSQRRDFSEDPWPLSTRAPPVLFTTRFRESFVRPIWVLVP